MNITSPISYNKSNPPPDIDTALNKIAELSEVVSRIHSQMGQANIIINDRSISWKDPSKKEKIAWKARANIAKGINECEMTFLKNWVRTERQKSIQLVDEVTVNPKDPRSLLAASRRVLLDLVRENTIHPDELTLLKMIERYLNIR